MFCVFCERMMQELELQVMRMPRTSGLQVTAVLAESFYDYPVMRYVLGDSADYERRLQQMIGLFVSARTLLDDVILGIMAGAELVAVATTSNPARPAHPDFAALRDAVWTELGAESLTRYQACVRAWDGMASSIPQLHVNMIGVKRAYQGKGLARRLLEAVHQLAAQTSDCQGVSLTTEDPRNVTFYQHLGYDVIGQAPITSAVQAWSFFRKRVTEARG
jgi:GNAT superfamily N-acetyltransferase